MRGTCPGHLEQMELDREQQHREHLRPGREGRRRRQVAGEHRPGDQPEAGCPPSAGRRHQPPGGHGAERAGDRHQREPTHPPDRIQEHLRAPVLVQPRPAGRWPGEHVDREDGALLDHQLARLDVIRQVDRARGRRKLHHPDGAQDHDHPEPRQAQPPSAVAPGPLHTESVEADVPVESRPPRRQQAWPPSRAVRAARESLGTRARRSHPQNCSAPTSRAKGPTASGPHRCHTLTGLVTLPATTGV